MHEHVLSGEIGGLQSDVGVHDATVRSLQVRQVGPQKVDELKGPVLFGSVFGLDEFLGI